MIPGEHAIGAIAELITEILRAQGRELESMTPEQREKWWDLRLRMLERWDDHAQWWHDRIRVLAGES